MSRTRGGVIALLFCTLAGATWAQSSGGDFRIGRSVIAAGSIRAAGATFTVATTVGQHDAIARMSGGSFRVSGGFWPASSAPSGEAIFDDGFETR
jgi:hypothetical protein